MKAKGVENKVIKFTTSMIIIIYYIKTIIITIYHSYNNT